jgi:hypothetical protein
MTDFEQAYWAEIEKNEPPPDNIVAELATIYEESDKKAQLVLAAHKLERIKAVTTEDNELVSVIDENIAAIKKMLENGTAYPDRIAHYSNDICSIYTARLKGYLTGRPPKLDGEQKEDRKRRKLEEEEEAAQIRLPIAPPAPSPPKQYHPQVKKPKVRTCSVCKHPLKGLTHPECTYELVEKRNRREEKKEQALKNKDALMCVVCISARAEYAITPCGHMCACVTCYKKITGNCPVCRASIDQIIKIFTVYSQQSIFVSQNHHYLLRRG